MNLPQGMHVLSPHLVCNGAAAAIDFYERAFGVIEDPFGHRWSIATPGAGMNPEELVAASRRATA